MGHTYNERAPSVHFEHTGQHHASHNSHDEEVYNFKRKVDWLRQRLHHKAWKKEERTLILSHSSSFEDNISYWRRSRTPPSESFILTSRYTFGKRHHHKRSRTPPRRSVGNDAMGNTLLQISRSPFTRHIEQVELPCCFNQPTFTIYNGKMDSVEHVSYFNQRMAIHSKNKALMWKVFPSSLGPVAMKWFDGLEEGLIGSFIELMRAFEARFVTYSRVPRPLDSLLSMSMREGETLKNYFDRY